MVHPLSAIADPAGLHKQRAPNGLVRASCTAIRSGPTFVITHGSRTAELQGHDNRTHGGGGARATAGHDRQRRRGEAEEGSSLSPSSWQSPITALIPLAVSYRCGVVIPGISQSCSRLDFAVCTAVGVINPNQCIVDLNKQTPNRNAGTPKARRDAVVAAAEWPPLGPTRTCTVRV